MVVAVAAGAGLGGVYDAPLAGMFFAVEILLVDVTIEKVAFGLGMSPLPHSWRLRSKGITCSTTLPPCNRNPRQR